MSLTGISFECSKAARGSRGTRCAGCELVIKPVGQIDWDTDLDAFEHFIFEKMATVDKRF